MNPIEAKKGSAYARGYVIACVWYATFNQACIKSTYGFLNSPSSNKNFREIVEVGP